MDVYRCETCKHSIPTGKENPDALGDIDYICKNEKIPFHAVSWCQCCIGGYEMMDFETLLDQPNVEERIMKKDLKTLKQSRKFMIEKGERI